MQAVEVGAPLPLTDGFMQDPFALYEQMRREGPVREVILPRGLKVWMVTRYEEARAALADPSMSKDSRKAGELFEKHITATGTDRVPFTESLAAHMLNSDPPDHTRLRKLVTKAFTAGTVQKMQPRIEQITESLLDEMAGKDTVDLLEAFAFPLPITVICELLGVPQSDQDDFRSWTDAILSAAGGDAMVQASMAMAKYLSELIVSKRENPGDDLLSGLIEVSEEGDRLTDVELVSMAFLLLVAGHETTVNLIGNGVLALLRNPDQLAALRADSSLLPNAIEEFLRFEGPINTATIRFTTQPLRVGEIEIPEGEFVMVALNSANRDDEKFADADRLDITRKSAGHLAFGHGIHYCLGAPLARMEGQIAIGRLVERFPDLALAAEPEQLRWRDSTLIHGLVNLPVSLGSPAK